MILFLEHHFKRLKKTDFAPLYEIRQIIRVKPRLFSVKPLHYTGVQLAIAVSVLRAYRLPHKRGMPCR